MRNISIEIKMIFGAIFFALLLVGLERYEFSQNLVAQFLESKKAKNKLLIDTISPVIGLNISLGLESANQEYLTKIVKQNPDLLRFDLTGADGQMLYHHTQGGLIASTPHIDGIYHAVESIKDPVTGEKIATVSLFFDHHEYQVMLQKNQYVSIKIFAIALIILAGFIFYIRKEFTFLKKLSENVLQYDPYSNHFALTKTDRKDEVGIIHNAIVGMVENINTFTVMLDEINKSLALKVEERTKELQDANLKLQELSTTDPLTQLPNRRHLENHLQKIWELAKRNSVNISIIMSDIDHFKQVNDIYGHIIGDFVLKDVARIIQSSIKRSTDFIARYGGEEFIIVLYDTDLMGTEELGRTIQNNLKAANGFEYHDVKLKPVTMSFGIGSIVPNEMSEYHNLIKLADRALYQAKESGRDRIVSVGN
ncbi:MAG: GGDEF domain-containing protein [Sulfuricurvum sp.]|jgi:diguanylate cyclase (GGDEF)-like protein|uniref:GGDEF domain-containing protein n=1 Tax=Sulfuricurvum sp. TaxID=2025608 RepID=UPI0025DBDA35|nr:GGDEF domain-containing protein [Sulfuricurvum sp.]MCK9373027.1 GGDEF domain-containing protein [Sulfuricurvum sp.]